MALMIPDDLDQYQQRGGFPPGYPPTIRRLFSPDDLVHEAICAAVKSAISSIVVCMYGFDDDEINDLFREKLEDERVYVQIALDSSQAGGLHEKALLAKWPGAERANNIVIGQSRKHRISHTKLILLDHALTIGGSTNLSIAGESLQNNEAWFLFDPTVAGETRTKCDLTWAEMKAQSPALVGAL